LNQEFPKYLTKDFGILGKQLFNKGFIKPLELYIIDRMAVLFDEDDPEVLTALALAYHSPFQGHVGIDIQRFPDQLLKAFNTELNNLISCRGAAVYKAIHFSSATRSH
jgi:hypothetical protein